MVCVAVVAVAVVVAVGGGAGDGVGVGVVGVGVAVVVDAGVGGVVGGGVVGGGVVGGVVGVVGVGVVGVGDDLVTVGPGPGLWTVEERERGDPRPDKLSPRVRPGIFSSLCSLVIDPSAPAPARQR